MPAAQTRNRPPAVILTATIAAAMLVVANVSVLNVALPELSVELSASQSQSQWMVDIYAVVLASLLLPIGAIGDRFGRRLILLVGLTILVVANAATIGLETANQVIVARAFSGVGAAFVFPATLSTITATLPDEKRSRGVALWTASVALGGFAGIIASGVLIENFWWGSLFLAMAIATGVVLLFCVFAIPDSSDPSESNLDPLGGLFSVLAVGGLVLGIIEGPVEGWTSPLALGGLVVGVLALCLFIWREMTVSRPLLDVRLFRQRGLRAGSLSVFVQFIGAFGIFFLVVFYLAVVQGYGPLDIGLALIPIAGGLLPAAALAIPLANRFGRRAVGTFGMLIMAGAFAYGTTITVDSGLRHYFISLVGMGIGYGFAGPPATEAIVESLPQGKQGVASALNDVLRELGAAIGIAVAGSAFNSAYRSSIDDLSQYPDEVIDVVKETPFAAAPLAESLGEGGALLIADVQQAVVEGWSLGLWTLVIAMVIGTIGFAVWAPGLPSSDAEPAQHASGPEPEVPVEDTPVHRPVSMPGPLGAVEIAAAAEADLVGLQSSFHGISHGLELITLRSSVPVDMYAWSATEQLEVAERAAIAMAPPLAELERLSRRLVEEVRACDALVSGGRAELVRIGQSPRELHVMDERITEVGERSDQVVELVATLDERFGHLASRMSTLRPASDQIVEVKASLSRAAALIDAWRQYPDLAPPTTAETQAVVEST